MKRIAEYKKLFNVNQETDLKQLKTTYRNLVKEWHPDKFQVGDAGKEEAEKMSQQIIDAYHFLVSIDSETIAAGMEEYMVTIETGIVDFKHKGLLLELTFGDGSTYEYFGVSKNLFIKFVNSDKQLRFAKRNFFENLVYRKSKKGAVEA